MSITGFPVFAVYSKGQWFWLDIYWGNHHCGGSGWLFVIPWGKERKYGWRDDRVALEGDDCGVYLLGWTHGICPFRLSSVEEPIACVYECPNCENKRFNTPGKVVEAP